MRTALKIFLLVIISNGIFAQARQLDLATVLQLADANNKDIKLAAAEVRNADALYREALSSALPTVNLDFNYNRNFFDNFFYISMTDSLGRQRTTKFNVTFKNEYQMNAVLNQTLYSFGKVGDALDIANYYEDFTDLNFRFQREMVLNSVKKAFFRALLLEKVWLVAKDSESSARENYENIKARYDNGVVSEFALLQSEVRWQNSIPETMKARKNYELALNNLKALVDLPIDEDIKLAGDLEKFPPMPPEISSDMVFEERKDFNAMLLEKKMREKAVNIEFANHLPSINGSLVYTYSARSDEFKIDNTNDNLIFGLSVHIPVFSGGYTSAQVQKAKVELDKVETQIAKSRDNINIQLKNVYLRLKEAHERIIAGQKNVNTARRAFEIAETRVNNGLATQLELKDSRVLLDQARVSFYSAIYDYLNAYFDWQQTIGRVNLKNI